MVAYNQLIPIFVLTGFLGSGKTTLLNRMLRHSSLKDAAVLINEFGEVGLDHLLVEQIDDNTVLLEGGCLCCTIRDDLKETILNLDDQRARGEIPMYERMVIETTGLAEPGGACARHGATAGAVGAPPGFRACHRTQKACGRAAT